MHKRESWMNKHIIFMPSLIFFNSSRPGQNGRHFTDIFKCIFINKKCCISIWVSLKFVPKGLIDNVSIGSGNGLAPNRWQAITWSNADPFHWCIYVTLGVDELIQWGLNKMTNILEMDFMEWKLQYFDPNFNEICTLIDKNQNLFR